MPLKLNYQLSKYVGVVMFDVRSRNHIIDRARMRFKSLCIVMLSGLDFNSTVFGCFAGTSFHQRRGSALIRSY